MTHHNYGKYCMNGCANYHIVSGDSACNVTGNRLTSTKLQVILEVGCASFISEPQEPRQGKQVISDDKTG